MKRRFLWIKCQKCGFRYKVYAEQPIVCEICKNDKWYCRACGKYFDPSKTEKCPRCKKPICPFCGNCECYRPKYAKQISFYCLEDNHETIIKLKQEIKCPKCGWDKWKCWNCGKWQKYEKICGHCRWFICKYCGACGCSTIKHSQIFVLPLKVKEAEF